MKLNRNYVSIGLGLVIYGSIIAFQMRIIDLECSKTYYSTAEYPRHERYECKVSIAVSPMKQSK
jgi:hypothetical protein